MSGRAIVIGFDALDPRLCREWMRAGRLPNFVRLAERGGFAPLATTIPCQSPVAWRSFSVGGNPGRHGIFDFLERRPDSYLPMLATTDREMVEQARTAIAASLAGGAGLVAGGVAGFASRRSRLSRRALLGGGVALGVGGLLGPLLRSWMPSAIPAPVNTAHGTPFWAHLGAAGLRSTVLWVPAEFPPRAYPGARVLSGLGVPDARGTNGTYVIHEAGAATTRTEMGGERSPLVWQGEHWEGTLHGPGDPVSGGAMDLPLRLVAQPVGGMVVSVGPHRIPLQEAEWSPAVTVEFRASPLVGLRCRTRFLLQRSGDRPRLYQAPLNFDQTALPPTVDLSQPRGFAAELVARYGPHESLGWNTDTWAFSEGDIDATAYLADWQRTIDAQLAIVHGELARQDWDCLVAVIQATDHIQHVFWRELAAGSHGGWDVRSVIAEAYVRADRALGLVLDGIDDDDLLIVCSDHGFQPWHRAVHLNSWLIAEGLQAQQGASATKGVADLAAGGQFFEHVDWFHTRAYAMGLGSIYLNKRDREPAGIVRPGEDQLLLDLISERLRAWRDPETGAPVVRAVYRGAELYRGAYAGRAPDLLVGFHPGYRVSWQTCLGGAPTGLISDNRGRWSGDHCSQDPAATPGVLFANRSWNAAAPRLIDLAPSLLAHFGVARPADYDGQDLWS